MTSQPISPAAARPRADRSKPEEKYMTDPTGTPTEYVNLPKTLSRRYGQIQIHPELRDLIPQPTKEEMQRLETALVEDGLRDPIVVGLLNGGRDKVLLDGHTRLSICARMAIDLEELVIHTVIGDDLSWAKRWILRNQLGRRNLTDSQRSMIAGRLADLDRGDNQHTSQDGTSQAEAADVAGVSLGSVSRAIKVLHHGAPELVQAVDLGRVDVTSAAAVATLPQEKQTHLLKQGVDAVKVAAKEVRTSKARPAGTQMRGTTVRLQGSIEIDTDIIVKASAKKAVTTAGDRLRDFSKAFRLLRPQLDFNNLVDAISRAVQTGKLVVSRADEDEEKA
jgi:hypothetical protein